MSTVEEQSPRALSDEQIAKALAAAQQFAGAVFDIIEAMRDFSISSFESIGNGGPADCAVDALRLMIEASGATEETDEATTQLYGALIRYLEERT